MDKLCTLLHFVAVSADPPTGPGERSLGDGDARDTHTLGHSYGGSVITGFDRVPSSYSPFISQPLRLGAVIMKTCPDLAALATG